MIGTFGRYIVPALCWGVSLAAGVARADQQPDLRRLFPFERDIFIDREGLVRLPIPSDVLAASRPDLSDLRVFDADGREVPYAIDAGSPGQKVEMVQQQPAVVVEARREEIPREHAPALFRETYVLAA